MAESRAYRLRLVEQLRAGGQLKTDSIAQAVEAVPRELFVPGVALDEVYRSSEAILIKRIGGVGVSSASAPDVMACMLEQLQPLPGHRVLEIGAGTGYNAALLAHLVGPEGSVVSLDIDADLVTAARVHLASAGYERVRVVQADGALGFDQAAPYDRIILTAASRDIAPAWREQLAPHGRLLLPLGIRGVQRCIAFERAGDELESVSTGPCSFIPLRGALSMDSARVPLDSRGAVMVGLPDDTTAMQPERVLQWLVDLGDAHPSGITARPEHVRNSLQLWLAAHDPRVCSIWAEGSIGVVPVLLGRSERVRATIGLLEPDGLALLAWGRKTDEGSELCAHGALAEHLIEHVQKWAAAGRPSDASLSIRALRRPTATKPLAHETAIDQRWTRFILSWGT